MCITDERSFAVLGHDILYVQPQDREVVELFVIFIDFFFSRPGILFQLVDHDRQAVSLFLEAFDGG